MAKAKMAGCYRCLLREGIPSRMLHLSFRGECTRSGCTLYIGKNLKKRWEKGQKSMDFSHKIWYNSFKPPFWEAYGCFWALA